MRSSYVPRQVVAGSATRSASSSSSSPYGAITAEWLLVCSGTPGVVEHTLKSNGGQPSSVRSIPNTSDSTPNSNRATSSIRTTAIFRSMRISMAEICA